MSSVLLYPFRAIGAGIQLVRNDEGQLGMVLAALAAVAFFDLMAPVLLAMSLLGLGVVLLFTPAYEAKHSEQDIRLIQRAQVWQQPPDVIGLDYDVACELLREPVSEDAVQQLVGCDVYRFFQQLPKVLGPQHALGPHWTDFCAHLAMLGYCYALDVRNTCQERDPECHMELYLICLHDFIMQAAKAGSRAAVDKAAWGIARLCLSEPVCGQSFIQRFDIRCGECTVNPVECALNALVASQCNNSLVGFWVEALSFFQIDWWRLYDFCNDVASLEKSVKVIADSFFQAIKAEDIAHWCEEPNSVAERARCRLWNSLLFDCFLVVSPRDVEGCLMQALLQEVHEPTDPDRVLEDAITSLWESQPINVEGCLMQALLQEVHEPTDPDRVLEDAITSLWESQPINAARLVVHILESVVTFLTDRPSAVDNFVQNDYSVSWLMWCTQQVNEQGSTDAPIDGVSNQQCELNAQIADWVDKLLAVTHKEAPNWHVPSSQPLRISHFRDMVADADSPISP